MKLDSQLKDLVTTKHHFSLPLDYQKPNGEQIKIFAREVVSVENQNNPLPYLVFFQGGPGFGAVRCIDNSGWIKRATKEFRVLLLDQRGTGLSAPVNYASLSHLSPEAQAQYLTHFRADSIIQDAEAIRAQLCKGDKWHILGQSFGGFCVLKYLSDAPEGLEAAYITGGLPSLNRSAEEVYQATFKRVQSKNNDFFSRFKDARQLVDELATYIDHTPVYLASGEKLTREMLQLLGINLGMEQGPEAVYYLLEQALIDTPTGKQINPLFCHHFCQLLDYNTNPIFALLHESIYCQRSASNWAAHRVRAQLPEFNVTGNPTQFQFTGEMIFPWMFDQFSNLKPLKQAAEILAMKTDWPELYDVNKLKHNTVPVAAAIYSEDMYVEMDYSLETAKQVGNLTYWLTSEYEHNGIRMDGEKILDKLIALNDKKQLR